MKQLLRGGIIGGLSGGIGAAIDGQNLGQGFIRGFKSGAIGGAISTGINIAILGPTIRPSSGSLLALRIMEQDLGISLVSGANSPVFRTGGIWQRGLTVGRNLLVGKDVDTWVHESFHFYQQHSQTWAGQLGRGVIEQYIIAAFIGNPYLNQGCRLFGKCNEYTAYQYELNFSEKLIRAFFR